MDQIASTRPGDAKNKPSLRIGMKGLLLAVACCALVIWAGLTIRDELHPYQPLRAIHSGNSADRKSAAQDLLHDRNIEPDRAIAGLTGALDDQDAEVRAVAAQCIGSLVSQMRDRPPSGPEGAQVLKHRVALVCQNLARKLSDRDPGVRAAAAKGLATMAHGPTQSADPPQRRADAVSGRYWRNTAYPNRTRPKPEQLSALRGNSSATRRQAAKALYGSPDMTLPTELVHALQDESPDVRAAAARALGSFGTELDRVIPTLIAMMAGDETKVHEACAGALGAAWPSRELVSTLIAALKSRDPDVRFHSAHLLGRIGPEARAAIPALITVLNEPLGPKLPIWDPAQAAARALGMMGPDPQAIAALIEVISPEKVARLVATYPKPEPLPAAKREPGDRKPPPPDARLLSAAWESERIIAAVDALGDIGPPAIEAVPALIADYEQAIKVRLTIAEEAIPVALGQIARHSARVPEVVATLIRALELNDDFFRRGAVEALGDLGPEASAAIPKLRALKERLTFIRDAAANALASIEGQPDPPSNQASSAPKKKE